MIGYRQRIADYSRLCLLLVWQRQAMLFGGFVMIAFFYDLMVGLFCYCMCLLSDLHDIRTCRAARDWSARDGMHPAEHIGRLTRSAMLFAGAISFSMILVAVLEGPGLHLGPLGFLFAAALFSAMNNCHVRRLLRARLDIYRAALLFIPLRDLVIVQPPLTSPLWMQLVTVLFLLFMLNECARSFAAGYLSNRSRLSELRDERERLVNAFRTQSQFVSIVSHELRTPLTSIKASLDLIGGQGQEMSPENVARLAGIGRKNADRLATLINDLLDFQKLTSGKMVFSMEPIDLNRLARETIEANAALGADRDIAIRLEPAPHPVRVRGDNDRLHQVLLNVLSNAVKFSEPGEAVRVRVESGDGLARILVRDTGIGIPPEAHDRVFAPFAQVDASDKRAVGGTGLGMSISRSIMESHGGRIDFESAPGEGTTFVIELARLPPEAEAEETGAAAAAGDMAVSLA